MRANNRETGGVRGSALLLTALLGTAATAMADVGEIMPAGPGNTFSIRITHGGNVIVDNPAVPFPTDFKLTDGDPEGFVQIGSTSGGYPIILKLVSDGAVNGVESNRTTHWYIDTPLDVGAGINSPGPDSLFDPNAPATDRIAVEVGNIAFVNTLTATPNVDQRPMDPPHSFFVSFMRDGGGRFYYLPNSNVYNEFGNGFLDIQVPGEFYKDGNLMDYNFLATSGPVVSWKWEGIINPGTGTLVDDGAGNPIPSNTFGAPLGYVYELGLGVAFSGELIPEPTSISLAAGSLLMVLRRRRR
ncbi:MAG: hypothetical protein L6Q92_10085 [Phycisphaerae bacterium]|nr:hypothetical protein [Phycisphaerae bacterium]